MPSAVLESLGGDGIRVSRMDQIGEGCVSSNVERGPVTPESFMNIAIDNKNSAVIQNTYLVSFKSYANHLIRMAVESRK
jgi:hypothetical protein